MKFLLLLLLFSPAAFSTTVTKATTITISAGSSACPVTVGTLTLNAVVTRSSGISPFLVFYDATATSDSSVLPNMTTFQDVTYTWNFGDGGPSGTSTWAYGSNPGVNLRNVATGGIAAHLYITTGSDTTYNPSVTATDKAGNTATCTLGVTAFDPAGTNGFPGAATTCVAQSTLPVAGAGGCPTGAGVLTQASFATALSSKFGAGKRVLFRCGDTFTGDNVTLTAIKWSVGAYGGCEGTQTNLPIFLDTVVSNDYQLYVGFGLAGGGAAGDGRISDIAFNGNGGAGGAVNSQAFVNQAIPYQITLWNLQSTGAAANFAWYQGAQWGLIGSSVLNTRTGISVFFNNLGNNPTGFAGTFPNINYLAVLGNFVNGIGAAGGSGSGIEAMRTASCRLCLYENNTVQNANNVGGVFKFNSSNTYQSLPTWDGFYTELIEISDNLFTGNSGGVLSDIAPENGGVDERERNIVIERNIYNSTTNGGGDTLLLLSAANATLRDNAFYMPALSSSIYAGTGAIVAQRGSGGGEVVQFNEAFNNTCFAPNHEPSQQCIGFDTSGSTVTATANSFGQNNLFYVPTTATGPAVHNTGTGNTVSNNTATVTANPGFTNGGGSFLLMTDFKPTANFSGGTSVPVFYDALGNPWPPTWDLGAVHH